MSWPGLPTWQMHTPATYVVDSDLRELPSSLAKRFASELQQWRKRDQKRKLRREWLSPVQMAILSVQGLFRGLRTGDLGCGIQASAEAWARQLGCKPRAVTKAFEKLKRRGLLQRHRRLVPHRWVDGTSERTRADVHGVSYLTDAGAAWLAKHAGATRKLVVASTWDRGGRHQRILVASGLVGKLLETLREKLRRLAHRLSPLPKQDRPTTEDSYQRKRTETQRGSPGGNALGRSVSRRAQTSSSPLPDQTAAGMGVDDFNRLEQLWRRQNLHPSTAWPPIWEAICKMDDGPKKNARYRWAIRECEHWARRFSLLELQRLASRKGCKNELARQPTPAAPSTNEPHNWSDYE